MKIGIIGAGNMGGAIARGLAINNDLNAIKITVASPNNKHELDNLKADLPAINTSTSNVDAVKGADFIFIAVKPWLLAIVIDEIKCAINFNEQTIVSIVAGVSCEEIATMTGSENAKIIRLIPNTAIAVGESMTFIAANQYALYEASIINNFFNEMGKSMIIEERLMGAGTALASCGIAYAMRYIRAASEGGVELGFYAENAKEIVMQTLIGAVKLLKNTGNNPETEIDRVTTPGGITIKGLNEMEKYGFTTAVIEGLKASKK